MVMLQRGDKSDEVRRLQALLCLAGFDAKPVDGDYGRGTAAAVARCQRALGFAETGRADEATQRGVGMDEPDTTRVPVPCIDRVTVDLVERMFSPFTRRENIVTHLPRVLDALREADMDDRDLVLMCLATIRAETEGFEPIDEGISRFNTAPDGEPFGLYDGRLGNTEPGDGARFRGRGFVQLTGRENYARLDERLGLGGALVEQPERANDPEIAARVLAAFVADKRTAVKYAVLGRDLAYARRLVNGGSHGIERFVEAFETGLDLLSVDTAAAAPESAAARARSAATTIVVDRFVSDDDSTVSRISVDGAFVCFGLEDEFREVKVAKETRIPAGEYPVRLRTEGGFHERYRQRFGAMHRGMLHIQDVPGFEFILIHCGNTDEDTAGCLLVGDDATTTPGDMRLVASRSAYKRFYPMVVDAAERGELTIRIEDNDRPGSGP